MSLLLGTKRALFRGSESYRDKVLSTGPIAYWIQGESTGGVAYCQISGAQNGAYTGVTLGQAGIGDGYTCPLYDGANDYNNVQTATLTSVFNGAAGTLSAWAKVSAVGVWTDATQRNVAIFRADANNYLFIVRRFSNNDLLFRYIAGGTNKEVILGGLTTVDWMHVALTWDINAGGTGEMKAYYAGVQTGATQVGLGVWAGALALSLIGAGTLVPAAVWSGYSQHVALFDRALPSGDIADLAVI